MLDIAGLNFFYRDKATKNKRQALNQVNLKLPFGSLLGLFGENGSGKTTLLKMLGGSLPVEEGAIELSGRSILGQNGFLLNQLRKDWGVLFQGSSSDEKISSFDNLGLAASLFGISPSLAQERIKKLLQAANLSSRALEPVKKLSGGMRRRLELYRTFLHKPKVVLLDEPTAGLDMHESAQFFSFIKSYQEENQALVLMSTHRGEEILHCDRVIMLKNGEVLSDSAPRELLDKLDYLCCSFAIDSAYRDLPTSQMGFFDMAYDEAQKIMTAKIPKRNVDSLLMDQLLKHQQLLSFTVEKPSLLDAYRDLASARN